MITNLQSLDGKYFIVLQPATDGDHRNGQRLWRGRILGQIVNELIPVWLCDVYPIDASELTVRSQTLMPLETLVSGWLYDDKEIWEIEFQEMLGRLEAAQAEAQKAMAAAARRQRALMRAASKDGSVGKVAFGSLEEIIDAISGSSQPAPVEEPKK